jgi:DNA-binding MarR family transcriptional regulator
VVRREPATREPATKIVAALDRLARGQRAFRQTVAGPLGLTPLQIDVLATIGHGPPPEPLVGLLARELGVSQPTITDAVGALEAKGLVSRLPVIADRRRTAVVLTPAGTEMVDELAGSDAALVDAVAALSRDDQETALEALLGLIGRLVDAGIIDVARTCFTCRFHDVNAGWHRCALLDVDLPPAELRVNCPEHQPAIAAAGS